MYDRVNLRLYVPPGDDVLGRLSPPSEVRQPDGSIIYRGEFGAFRYSLRGETIRLRGSLSRYVGTVPPSAVPRLAMERLSDSLGFDTGVAHVTRLEVFADLDLRQPVCLYLPLLWTLARHKRLTVDAANGGSETLKFMTYRRSLQFYDKGAQSGEITSGGLVRIELSYRNGGVSDQLGKGLTLSRIGEPDFRAWIAGEWRQRYQSVEKGRELQPDLGGSDFVRSLAAEAIYRRGVGNVLADIQAHRKGGAISKQRASDRRKAMLQLTRDPRFTRPSPLLAELDSAVANAARAMAL